MPNVFFDNIERWKLLAEIDYFTEFMKAWLVFNGWMSNTTRQSTDRAMLNHLKDNQNNFTRKIARLLNASDNDATVFKSYLAKLHQELEQTHVFNRGERVTFTDAFIQESTNTIDTQTRNRITYQVKRAIAGVSPKEIQSTVTNSTGAVIFSYRQLRNISFNLSDLRANIDFQRLTANQRANLEISYNAINPKETKNFLIFDGIRENKDYFLAGGVRFCKDDEAFCKAFIEMLYRLRCVLFHGEIVPDRNHNKIYEAAYHLLKVLIAAL